MLAVRTFAVVLTGTEAGMNQAIASTNTPKDNTSTQTDRARAKGDGDKRD